MAAGKGIAVGKAQEGGKIEFLRWNSIFYTTNVPFVVYLIKLCFDYHGSILRC